MSSTQLIDIYLFLVTGFGFWGALLMTRFFYMRWDNPTMKALTIFFALVAMGLGWLMLARLLNQFYGIAIFELSPLRQAVFRTTLTFGIWLLVWQVRMKALR